MFTFHPVFLSVTKFDKLLKNIIHVLRETYFEMPKKKPMCSTLV